MLLHEAATRALADRATHASPLLGRPTCMAIPAAMSSGVASSFGCVGNRIYTGIADDEFYSVIAGKDLGLGCAQLDTITSANARAGRVSHRSSGGALTVTGSVIYTPTLDRGILIRRHRAIARVVSERLETRLGVERRSAGSRSSQA